MLDSIYINPILKDVILDDLTKKTYFMCDGYGKIAHFRPQNIWQNQKPKKSNLWKQKYLVYKYKPQKFIGPLPTPKHPNKTSKDKNGLKIT